MCPRCGLELVRDEAREVWSCLKCKGVLCGVGELVTELVAIAPELVPDGGVGGLTTLGRRPKEHRMSCPTCGAVLEPVFLGGVPIDRCYHDELLWFDAGEQAAVMAVVREQHGTATVSWVRRLLGQWFGDAW
jgi:Zn-finger nucleic acid-binding protein